MWVEIFIAARKVFTNRKKLAITVAFISIWLSCTIYNLNFLTLLYTEIDDAIESVIEEEALFKKMNEPNASQGSVVDVKIGIETMIETFKNSTDFEKIVTQLAHPFKLKPMSAWCMHKNIGGMIYVKVPKTGSSIVSGVTERLKRMDNLKTGENCRVNNGHGNIAKKRQPYRKEYTFLFSTIRNPSTRAISRIFFSYDKLFKTDNHVIKLLKHNKKHHYGATSKGQGGFQVNYLSLQDIPINAFWKKKRKLNYSYEVIKEYVKPIIDEYDFLMLTERMDESFVIMSFILNISLSDVLYLPTKVSGNYWLRDIKTCQISTKSYISPTVGKYLYSKKWWDENYGDFLLYSIVNKSLDLTIDNVIGREKFTNALDNYISMKNLAQEMCINETIFPCSKDGIYQNLSTLHCYKGDWGCGWPCFDKHFS